MESNEIKIRDKQEIVCNKTNLNKLIVWTSSKWNQYKKSRVIDEIIFLVAKNKDTSRKYETGCYTENSSGEGYDYILEIKDGEAYLKEGCFKYGKIKLIPTKKQKEYKFAKHIKLIKSVYTWHSEYLGTVFEVVDEDVYNYEVEILGKISSIPKDAVEIID